MPPLDDTRARARQLKLMAFDVDGVLSDGTLFYANDGSEIKGFSSLDGLGLKLLQRAGMTIAVITGRDTPCVDVRMRHLGIDLLYQGVTDKLKVMNELLGKLGLCNDEAGYMGDDVIDIRVMAACGFSAAPADAQERVKPYARMIAQRTGGHGAVREVCEFILEAQGKLDEALAPFLPVNEK